MLQIAALERSRKIEELQKRLVESEMLRTRYNRKMTMMKDQLRTTSETTEQERSINDHSMQLVRDELTQVKQTLLEVRQQLTETTRRESQVRVMQNLDLSFFIKYEKLNRKIASTKLLLNIITLYLLTRLCVTYIEEEDLSRKNGWFTFEMKIHFHTL